MSISTEKHAVRAGNVIKAVRKHKKRLPKHNEFKVDGEHHKRNERCHLSSGLKSRNNLRDITSRKEIP